jgi:predicted acylesterase/phospholipase RssA
MEPDKTRKIISLKNTFKTQDKDDDIFDDIQFNKKIELEIDKLCNKKKKKTILILSGGGVKGILFVGALKYLEEHHKLDDIDTYLGTSFGGLFVFLLNIGYTLNELYKIIKFFDIKGLANIDFSNLMNNYSLISFDSIKYLLKRLLIGKNINPEITLLELYKLTKKKMIFGTVCITNKKLEYVSYETYPNITALLAIQMTISIPVIFPPVPVNNKHYIDGGFLDNFNVSIFNDRLDEVIGLNIVTEYDTYSEITSAPIYLQNLLLMIFLILNKTFDEEIYKDCVYNITVDKLNQAKTLNINITWEEKKKMINYGYEYMKKNCKH